jgi:hypothetical protein
MAMLATFGGSSPLSSEVHRLASQVADAPLRNGLTVLVAGLAIALPAAALGAIFRPPPEPAHEYGDQPAYVDADPPRR